MIRDGDLARHEALPFIVGPLCLRYDEAFSKYEFVGLAAVQRFGECNPVPYRSLWLSGDSAVRFVVMLGTWTSMEG